MSKYMQIAVKVNPYYQEDLARTYPKLARHLGYLDEPLVRSNPSLCALAGQLDQLLYKFEGTKLREVLLRRQEKLKSLHQSIETELANWNLAAADRSLYALEDIFDEIEGELD